MNWEKTKTSIYLCGLTLLAILASCKDDTVLPDTPEIDSPQTSVKKRANRFIAFSISVPGDPKTRAFDAEGEDIMQNEDKTEGFNKGLAFERALYFPSENNDDETGDDVEEGEDPEIEGLDSEDKEGDIVVPSTDNTYHFAVLFSQDGRPAINEPLKLDKLTQKETGEATIYTRFYDPEEETSPFAESFSGTVWVVLNASHDLVEWAKEALKTNTVLSSFKEKVLTRTSDKSKPDDFLYLKDKNGNFITDKAGNRYFTMTSSIVIDGGIATPAVTGGFKFWGTKEEAEQNATVLYVERLHAKHTVLFKVGDNLYYLTLPSPAPADLEDEEIGMLAVKTDPEAKEHLLISPLSTASPIRYVKQYLRSPSIENRNEVTVETATYEDWKINIIGWDINGIEKSEYLFKNITDKNYYDGWKSWGSYPQNGENYRTFWAEDPHYGSETPGFYPDQFRPAEDDDDIRSYDSGSNALDYFSFNQMINKNLRRYTSENTYDASILEENPYDTKTYLRAGSHLIVTAQLLIKGLEETDIYETDYYTEEGFKTNYYKDNARSKVLMKDIYWEEGAYKNYVCEYLGYFMMAAKNQSSNLFPDNDGVFYVKYRDSYIPAVSTNFTLAAANIKGGDGYVWIKPTEQLYSYNPNAASHDEAYTPISDTAFETLAYQHPELMGAHYKYGMMYYAAGSKHNLNSTNFKENKKIISTGDYGTVRNNWYAFTITGFTQPGTPVSEPTQKIVPNNAPYQEAMGVSLQIIDWHKVEESVNVAPQRPKDGQQ